MSQATPASTTTPDDLYLPGLKLYLEDEDSRAEANKEAEDKLVRYLARRAFHLPHNDCCADWFQYIFNNHPVLGIFCHHELHPVGTCIRLVALFGSFVFGLAISCIILLSMMYYDKDDDSAVFAISYGGGEGGARTTYFITQGMVALWTVGSGLHSLYDQLVWQSTACPCFQPGGFCDYKACGGCRTFGNHFVIFTVVLVTAVAALAVMLRAALESTKDVEIEELESVGILDDEIYLGDIEKESFSFLLAYLIEVALAQVLFYPITGAILFSGVLGCGRVPLLGGRPYAIRQEQTCSNSCETSACEFP